MQIHILRYGHRLVRDYRITSHCCLVARAFGAEKIVIAGNIDESVKKSVDSLVGKWGGNFKVEFNKSWRNALQNYKKKGFTALHLTMYGLPLQDNIKKLRKIRKLLLIIGSQKVEGEVYKLSDWNIAVTQQPHSEVAALAVVLDWLQKGKELGKKFKNARITVQAAEHGKKVVKK